MQQDASAASEQVRRALEEICGNLAFTWQPDARELLERVDPRAWDRAGGSPGAFLGEVAPEELDRAAADDATREGVLRLRDRLARELTGPTWWQAAHGGEDVLVAYFSSEFGVDESLPIYAGGLGVLAGDHLKSASQLGLPLVGVGLLYRQGYFRQGLDEDGWQQERYPENDPDRLPVILERRDDGAPVRVAVELAGEQVGAHVWRADVGRVRLYLLDCALEENSDAGRAVTATLYGGDREQRIRQEVVLGVGGTRALHALGLAPTVFHMNEGHAALLTLERIRVLVRAGLRFDEALRRVRASTAFTTHTPVPAGHDIFDPDLAHRYLAPLVAEAGVSWGELAALARSYDDDPLFGMTPLALRTSGFANGVSELHGDVSRKMWRGLWPDLGEAEAPIGHVTNGVHAPSWVSAPIAALLDAHGVAPAAAPAAQRWERAHSLDPGALWAAHADSKRALLAAAERRGAVLDAEALTIGFARRFATYKRAGLLFSSPERLARLLFDPHRPVQILLAGKAHPADDAGKRLIQQVVRFARSAEAGGRVVFLEDYDLALARALVQGCDVWLNTPHRPLEASGTSGMKAGMNGVLNLSVLDGWWYEGYEPALGWAIGDGDPSNDADADRCDGESLFGLLEQRVVPLFYEDRPRWIEMMRASIASVGAAFNTHRMVCQYAEGLYLPAHRALAELESLAA